MNQSLRPAGGSCRSRLPGWAGPLDDEPEPSGLERPDPVVIPAGPCCQDEAQDRPAGDASAQLGEAAGSQEECDDRPGDADDDPPRAHPPAGRPAGQVRPAAGRGDLLRCYAPPLLGAGAWFRRCGVHGSSVLPGAEAAAVRAPPAAHFLTRTIRASPACRNGAAMTAHASSSAGSHSAGRSLAAGRRRCAPASLLGPATAAADVNVQPEAT